MGIYTSESSIFCLYCSRLYRSMQFKSISMAELVSCSLVIFTTRSTPITISAPNSLATSTGKLSTTPPSTYTTESMVTGVNAVGIAIEARMQVGRFPLVNTFFSPLMASVPTQAKGTGISSKCSVSGRNRVISWKKCITLVPPSIPPNPVEENFREGSSR